MLLVSRTGFCSVWTPFSSVRGREREGERERERERVCVCVYIYTLICI